MAWQTIDGETVLLDADGKQLIGINDPGARVWALMDGTRSIGDIVRELGDEYDAPADVLLSDVRIFLAELIALGAVVL
jgi:hypothetical protein